MLKNGVFLFAVETNKDDVFFDSQVYLFSHNETGSIGFITNKLSKYRLIDAEPELQDFDLPILYGGPVDDEKMFILHSYPTILSYDRIENEICISSNFEELVCYLKLGVVDFSKIKLFMGYCGWDKGDLEEEIKIGCWKILEMYTTSLF